MAWTRASFFLLDMSTPSGVMVYSLVLMLPLAKRSMPDFGPVFARYATDLKQEAERAGAARARAA